MRIGRVSDFLAEFASAFRFVETAPAHHQGPVTENNETAAAVCDLGRILRQRAKRTDGCNIFLAFSTCISFNGDEFISRNNSRFYRMLVITRSDMICPLFL